MKGKVDFKLRLYSREVSHKGSEFHLKGRFCWSLDVHGGDEDSSLMTSRLLVRGFDCNDSFIVEEGAVGEYCIFDVETASQFHRRERSGEALFKGWTIEK